MVAFDNPMDDPDCGYFRKILQMRILTLHTWRWEHESHTWPDLNPKWFSWGSAQAALNDIRPGREYRFCI